jgi:aspartate kinase
MAGPVVLKFGGTSVGDAEAIGRLIRHVGTAHGRGTAVVVVSALSGVTDRLLQLAAAAARGEEDVVREGLAQLRARHADVAQQVAPEAAGLQEAIVSELAELGNLLHAVSTLKDASARSHDAVAAYGELLSSRIIEGAARAAGLPAVWVDARHVLVTDDSFGSAVPLPDFTAAAVTRVLRAALDRVSCRWSAGTWVPPSRGSPRRSVAAARTTRPPSSVPRWTPAKSRSGPTWTA